MLARHAADIAACRELRWVGYLSTTGVYGDTGGREVDEAASLNPSSERGRRRLDAEVAWLGLHREQGIPIHVFRLAGIYGPGRSVLDQVRAGRARRIDKPGQVFSRIHVDDIATVLGPRWGGPVRAPSTTSATTRRRRRPTWSPSPAPSSTSRHRPWFPMPRPRVTYRKWRAPSGATTAG